MVTKLDPSPFVYEGAASASELKEFIESEQ